MLRASSWLGGALAAYAAVSVAPTLAHAQQTQTQSADADRRARDEFVAGRDAFGHGNYGEAVTHFQTAYQLSNRPQLLYNLGTSYDRLHRWQEALDAFQQFQRLVPDAMEHDEVEARLGVIRQEITNEQNRAAELQRERDRAAAAQAETAARPVIVVQDPPRPWLYTALVTGGLGVVSLLVAGGIGIFGSIQYGQLMSSDCGVNGTCEDSVVSSLYMESTLINVFLINGGALVALAAISFALDHARPSPTTHTPSAHSRRIRPSIGFVPGAGAGLSIVGTF